MRRPPRLEVAYATADSHAGGPVADLYPSLAAAYPTTWSSTRYDAGRGRRPRPRVPRPCRTASPSRPSSPSCASGSGAIVDLAADFRLHDPALYPQLVRRGARRARPARPSSSTACPSCSGDDLAGATLVAAAGLLLDRRRRWRWRRCVRAGLIEPTGIIVDAASGVSGAGRAPKARTHFGTVDEDFTAYGLLDHRHTPEIEQSHRGAQVLFTPHLAPMNRGILATCYARPDRADVTTDDVLDALHDAYDDEPFVVVTRRAAVDQGHARLQRRPRHGPGRRPHRLGASPSCALDNLVKGASGQAIQCANLALGLPETDRSAASVGARTRERHRAEGLRGRRASRCGIKASRRARPGPGGHRRRPGRSPPPASSPSNLAAAAPVQVSRAHLAATGGRAAAVVLNSGNANAATGEPGPRRRRARCARWSADGARLPAEEVLVCSDRPHRHSACRSTSIRARRRRARGRPRRRPDGGRRRPRGHHDHRHRAARRSSSQGDGFTVGGMAKGAAMLAPEHGDDARRAHHRRRGRAAPTLQAALQRPRSPTRFNAHDRSTAARRPTTRCSCWPAARPGRADADAFDGRADRRPAPTSAEQMVGDAEGATKVVHGHGRRRGRATPTRAPAARKVAESQLVQVLAVRRGPVLGPGRQRARLGRRRLRPGPGVGRLRRRASCAAGGVAVDHDAAAVAAHMAGRHVEVVRRPRPRRRATAAVLTNDLSHGYIDENMGTS